MRFRTIWVNVEPAGLWSDMDHEVEAEIPDDAHVVGCIPSSVGYQIVLMEELAPIPKQ